MQCSLFARPTFQCSSASRKFLNCCVCREPDTPHLRFQCSSASRKFLNEKANAIRRATKRFSALQRAENSSMSLYGVSVMTNEQRFSALQRAENSSIMRCACMKETLWKFQCSSASRKFLNCAHRRAARRNLAFQCSSASRKFLNFVERGVPAFVEDVSVLFSEPKIPQCDNSARQDRLDVRFQCSSASRKFLNLRRSRASFTGTNVSVLFSEPKIPQ